MHTLPTPGVCIYWTAHHYLDIRSLCYRWTWIWRTQWDQENWSVICKIRRIHMTNTWYVSDWDQAYRQSYAKICCTVVCHIQVHLYIIFIYQYLVLMQISQLVKDRLELADLCLVGGSSPPVLVSSSDAAFRPLRFLFLTEGVFGSNSISDL